MSKSHKPFAVTSTITKLIEMYWDDPVAFAEDILGFFCDEWQKDVLLSLAEKPRVSVRSGQGVGKTALEAVAVIWFMCCRPNCRVVCTAPTRQQLQDVLWAEVKKRLDKSKVKNLLTWTATRIYFNGRAATWFGVIKTATTPDNMQGYHEEFMLFICDEASGIKDPIMEAVLGTLSGAENKLLMCGNPTRTSGTFYDSHHKDRDKFKTFKVSSLDSTRTNKENIEMLIRKYGRDSNVVRVRVFGEFPNAEPDVFIPLELAERATQIDVLDEKGKHTGQIYLGVDCARFGDDEIVIYPRIGPYVFKPLVFYKLRTTELAGHIVRMGTEMCNKYDLNLVHVNIDVGAMGGGVVDDTLESTRDNRFKWMIAEVPFGGQGDDDSDDMATIMYKSVRDLLQDESIQIPDDEKTIAQLSTRKYRVTVKGKLKLESKEDYKKRHEESPDRADALVLCFYEGGVDGRYITTTKELESKQKQRQPVTAGLRHKRF